MSALYHQEGNSERRVNPPPIFKSKEEYEEFIDHISRRGAQEVIRELGLEDPEFRKAFRDLIHVAPTLNDMAAGWSAMGWIRKAVLWLAGLGAGVAALYHIIFKGGPHG